MNQLDPDLVARMEDLKERIRLANLRAAAATKAHAAKPGQETKDALRDALAECERLGSDFRAGLAEAQRLLGLSDDDLQELEQARERDARSEKRFARREMLAMPITADLREVTASVVDQLRSLVPVEWLEEEARKGYRLDASFYSQPLHLVAGRRFHATPPSLPHRLARMILVSADFAAGHRDLDFLEAASLVPEAAQLGARLALVPALGQAAATKLARLFELPERDVISTVYELLVGTAFVERGFKIEMIDNRGTSEKSPDFRLTDFHVPAVVECKRRDPITEYEAAEARHVELLYAATTAALEKSGYHYSIEAEFSVEVVGVAAADFADAVQRAIDVESTPVTTPWGTVRIERLPFTVDLPRPYPTYAPAFLERVFGWTMENADWDGLLCRVEPPKSLWVTRAKAPQCLKWRTITENALVKKARGISSLYNEAAQQIPLGEWGIIFLAYREGGRDLVADTRTGDLRERVDSRLFKHRGGTGVPMIVVNRLIHLSKWDGVPDLIESSVPLYESGLFPSLERIPVNVFVPQRALQ